MILALLVSLVLAAYGHPEMLIFCIKAAVAAAVSRAIIAGAITAYKGGDIEDVKYAIRQGAVDGFKSGFSMAAITYGISSALKALASMKGAPNKADLNRGCSGESECFKEGTLVETEEGLKPIEEIEVGDKVLAYDEETGEQAYKSVVRLFRNETNEWYHIHVNGEEIVCTGGHPFYVLNVEKDRNTVRYAGTKSNTKGNWITAKDLQISDKLLLSDNACAIIEEIQVEQLSKPETTYNFEVEDYHTYYVSDSKVLVHNKCAKDYLDEALKRQGLDKVPEGGLKESWIEGDFKIEVRAHSGNPEFTNAKQIFRVSRRPIGGGKSTIQYLGSDNVWYGMSALKTSSSSFSSTAAALTHIPVP